MTGEQNTAEEPKQTARGLEPTAHPHPSEERDEDSAAEDRTSPFPYAENFEEWVADETAARDGRQHRSAAGDADG